MLYICAVPNTDKRLPPKNRVKVESFEERLEDIKKRRGENSPHYINSKIIIEELKNKNFLD